MKNTKTKNAGNLIFGNDVKIGDFIRMSPTSTSLTRIDRESQLDSFKKEYPKVEVIIDREKPWFSVFTVPSWKSKIESMDNGIVDQLNKWNQ